MVKIFIGNLSQHAEKDEVEALFAKYGTVTECAKYKNYAFVHMEDRKAATKAIRELHLYKLSGRPINVEPSRGKNQGPVKLHVANVEKGYSDELRALFEEYGTVSECSIVKDFAFVHMDNSDEAMDAMKGLDNTEFQGKRIHVQISKSRRAVHKEDEYPPPPNRGGYYPPRYPGEMPEPPYRGRMSAYPPPPPPPPPPPRRPAYPDRGYGERDGYGVVDYYEKYRARPYSIPGYDDRRSSAIPPPPPPPSALVRERLGMGSLDPYERRPLPPPPPTSYMARDRSPIRRAPLPPAPSAGNGYPYERSRLSPLSRSQMYAAPRPRDSFSERVQPLPPPPPRYASY
ncbi:RNA-binding protein 4.1-like [Thunnus thynnus]|uniref:RNA-binding protein 4.1-like n=1 Tax=Thunnus maccoyii TaxID=8240 RepID=UPI001C4CEF61|nr:RNA-binding protein 4.1-like [Thunnus maccoyii]XP_042257469.1 RNA-binding protein 4.1-like [Thunnus maccoyii]XP_042257471.1 RNA-binding protein 4.1-like [Thunnus maccoyii]XP_042257472.1 RNA-binding protein 4.1-like [Thunnus maccoyii]|eukprot:superscaffoldBa00002941_g15700